MGQTALFLSEGRHAEDFFALKNPTASVGFQPANLGTKGQHATSRPQKPLESTKNSEPYLVVNCIFYFSYYYRHFFITDIYKKTTQVTLYCHYIYTYSFFIQSTEFHVARMHTKFCRLAIKD